jgi:hypothetical protein
MNARPTDPMTAQDGVQILTQVRELTDIIKGFSNRISVLQNNNITILEVLARIDSGLAGSRAGRLEAELREMELEKELAERRLKVVEEKLEIKKNESSQSSDTNEKIRAGTASVIADLEKQRKENADAFWLDVRRSIVKGVLVTLSVGAVTATLAFIWWLVMLYMNR